MKLINFIFLTTLIAPIFVRLLVNLSPMKDLSSETFVSTRISIAVNLSIPTQMIQFDHQKLNSEVMNTVLLIITSSLQSYCL